jgi:glycosyltransferase involved in cell wall biosynthesis
MKLLHVIGSMNPNTGGPCQGIRNLAAHTLAKGNTVEVVCLDDPDSDYLSRENLRIHALGKGRGPWGYHPALRPWLKKNLPRFDAVILNGLWQYQGYALLKTAQTAKTVPYFVFPHGMLDPWFQRARERRWKAVRNWFYWKLIEQKVIRHAAAIFFTCGEEMRLAGETFRPYQPKRQVNVGYGVSQPPAYDKEMKQAFAKKCPGLGEKKYFLFLGRIHPKKGVDLLIRSYAALCRSNDDSAVPNLVIAGPGLETSYGQKMQQLAAEMCPPNSIFWPGMLSGDDKWGALYNCEVSVLPSHQENFGIAVVETLACGRPVLISDQVNIWRELKETGAALVQKNSVAGTAQLFQDWTNLSPDAKSKMAAQAKFCFQNFFSVESLTSKVLAVVAREKNPQ